MGVDTYIFDTVSKECFYFDRNYNWFTYLESVEEIQDRASESDETKTLTAEEVIKVCGANIDYWNNETNETYRAKWNWHILIFVADRPNGKFFFRNDHQSPPSWDYLEQYLGTGGYKEVWYE